MRRLPSRRAAAKNIAPAPAETPILLRGQEDAIVDQQLLDVTKDIERLVQRAVGCNKGHFIIAKLRSRLNYLDNWVSKTSRPRTKGGAS